LRAYFGKVFVSKGMLSRDKSIENAYPKRHFNYSFFLKQFCFLPKIREKGRKAILWRQVPYQFGAGTGLKVTL
jgi:hypothetical protein